MEENTVLISYEAPSIKEQATQAAIGIGVSVAATAAVYLVFGGVLYAGAKIKGFADKRAQKKLQKESPSEEN